MRPAPFWLVLLVLPPLVALCVLPPFGQRMVILAGIYGLMGLGYQLVFGQLGALNLAQGALFGLGAYAAALTAPILGAVRLARGDPRRGDPGGAGGGRRCCACSRTTSRSPPWRSPRWSTFWRCMPRA